MPAGPAGAGYARVAVPVPVRKTFTYLVPEELREGMAVGVRVRVPFGPRRIEGTVVEWPAEPPDDAVDVRPVDGLVPDAPIPTAPVLATARFVADYYLCSLGEAIETTLPPAAPPVRRVRAVRRLPPADPGALPPRAGRERAALEALPAAGDPVPITALESRLRPALRQLQARGWVAIENVVPAPDSPSPSTARGLVAAPVPTPGQASVLERVRQGLDAGGYGTSLLFGATGSGKTEVYFRAAREALDRGRGVIYLVPEIGLTPLLLNKVAARFADDVVVLHSGLPPRARRAGWEALRDGRCRFVVGTRSAVFAPVRDLGLVVVDEEQDGSYKQGESPRYNGRDLAIWRAQAEGALALLGSATPSVESFHHARERRYALLPLGGRVEDRALAEVLLVDMREEYRRRGEITPLSETLAIALADCVGRGEQALVLRNRRGWSAAVLCGVCGGRVNCTRCSVALTWHRREARLRCHYCGFETAFPDCCPTCGAEDMQLLGEGTEQIEDLIRNAVPTARVARMDRDVLRHRGAHEDLLRRFDRGEIDVMVGTQMIAKGHDFPRVTLVGVISADHALGLPDFRAGERTFQLLTQVAGRAGRGDKPGRVVAQVFQPEHPLVRLAVAQDYEAFFEREIAYRRALRYPPFTALVQILVLDREEHRAREWSEVLADALREAGGGRLLLAGPGPAPLERLKGQYRRQILARTAGRRRLVEAVDRALAAVEGKVPRRAIHVDVDPYSVL